MSITDESLGYVGEIGPDALENWVNKRPGNAQVDVVLLTHPRDEADVPRMFPWSEKIPPHERHQLTRHLKPIVGEVVSTPSMNIGVMFVPFFASDVIDAKKRNWCRSVLENEAIAKAAEIGAEVVSLGGLTGSLSIYGRRLVAPAQQHGISVTTGHAATSVSVLRTYQRALADFNRRSATQKVVVLGVGSIGRTFTEILQYVGERPAELVLVDKPHVAGKLAKLAAKYEQEFGTSCRYSVSNPDGTLPEDSDCYSCDVLVSAVSMPNVVDVARVRPGTILVDDSQPYCWQREAAWRRCATRNDIAPCEAGLVDCTSIGFKSQFPFDFAECDEFGSSVAWSCLSEAILLAMDPSLKPTIGEPTIDAVIPYLQAFDRYGFGTPSLQCGEHVLPIEALRANLSN